MFHYTDTANRLGKAGLYSAKTNFWMECVTNGGYLCLHMIGTMTTISAKIEAHLLWKHHAFHHD